MGHIGCMGYVGRFFQKTGQAAASISPWLRRRCALTQEFLRHGSKPIAAAWSLGQPEGFAPCSMLAFDGTLCSRR